MMKNKLQNKGLWVAMFSLLALVLQDFLSNFNEGRYDLYVEAILTFLIAAGIISNPTVGSWFTDKENETEKEGEL